MNEKTYPSKIESVYQDTKTRALDHMNKLKNAKKEEVIESDRIFQYLQQTIDCLQLCIDHLPKESETKMRYARYKDELGELGEEIVKLTNPNRW